MYICVYAYVCIDVCICVDACVYVYIRVCVYICMCMYIQMLCMCVYMNVYVDACMSICIYSSVAQQDLGVEILPLPHGFLGRCRGLWPHQGPLLSQVWGGSLWYLHRPSDPLASLAFLMQPYSLGSRTPCPLTVRAPCCVPDGGKQSAPPRAFPGHFLGELCSRWPTG